MFTIQSDALTEQQAGIAGCIYAEGQAQALIDKLEDVMRHTGRQRMAVARLIAAELLRYAAEVERSLK